MINCLWLALGSCSQTWRSLLTKDRCDPETILSAYGEWSILLDDMPPKVRNISTSRGEAFGDEVRETAPDFVKAFRAEVDVDAFLDNTFESPTSKVVETVGSCTMSVSGMLKD